MKLDNQDKAKLKPKTLKILGVINMLLLLLLVGFYTYRLVYYYLQENGTSTKKEKYLVEEILKGESLVDSENGLVRNEENNTFTFKGNTTDNYLTYSGRTFRIIGVDSENNIKLITEKEQTSIITGLENGYEKSIAKTWLNPNKEIANSGIFYNSLNNSETLLTTSNICTDVIEDIETITCDKIYAEDKIGLLSLNEYKEAGGAKSYLNNGTTWALSTSSKENNWIVLDKGDLNLNEIGYKFINIRPVITLKGTTLLVSGSGTKKEPYIIEKTTTAKTLEDSTISEYITLDNYLWKIVNKETDKVKVVMEGYIKEDDTEITKKFSTSSNLYSINKSSIGYYLNNDFYNSLSSKGLLVKGDWYIGKSTSNDLSYLKTYTKKINNYVGLLAVGDLFINEYANTFTLTGAYEASDLIYIINEENNLYADLVTNNHKIRPAIYLNIKSTIKSGTGTETKPYVLAGDINE